MVHHIFIMEIMEIAVVGYVLNFWPNPKLRVCDYVAHDIMSPWSGVSFITPPFWWTSRQCMQFLWQSIVELKNMAKYVIVPLCRDNQHCPNMSGPHCQIFHNLHAAFRQWMDLWGATWLICNMTHGLQQPKYTYQTCPYIYTYIHTYIHTYIYI